MVLIDNCSDLIQPDRAYLASRVHDCPWGPRAPGVAASSS